jgi:hypothetical protein
LLPPFDDIECAFRDSLAVVRSLVDIVVEVFLAGQGVGRAASANLSDNVID